MAAKMAAMRHTPQSEEIATCCNYNILISGTALALYFHEAKEKEYNQPDT